MGKAKQNTDFELILLSHKPETIGVNQWVYQSLRHAVMIGQIQPGLPLTIRGIADKLGVSPMPVREALHCLTCEGALELKDNRRVIVPRMTAAKFKALYELRIALETHAADSVLPYAQHRDIEQLQQLDQQIDQAIQQDDSGQITQTNQAFHRYLYLINPNQVALPAIESVWLQLGPFLRLVRGKLAEFYKVDRHQEAISALEQHNAFALRRAIEGDIRDGMVAIEAVDKLDEYFS